MHLDILAIDDSKLMLGILAGILEKRGHRFQAVVHPQDGLRALQDRIPDLVLLDVEMPDIDGYQACRTLKADPRLRDVPVLFLSVHHDEESIVQGFASGGSDYIRKPFTERELVSRVEAHGLRSRLEREMSAQAKRLEELAASQEREIQDRTRELKASQDAVIEILSRLAREEGVRERVLREHQVEGLGRLIADVEHQVNTPLGNSLTMTGFLHRRLLDLRDRHREGRMGRQDFESVMDETLETSMLLEKNLHAIERLMASMRRIDPGQYRNRAEPFMLGEVWANVLASHASKLTARGIKVHTIDRVPGPVVGYPLMFVDVFQALLSNSLDHAFDSGGGTIRFFAEAGEETVRIAYQDDGCGIPDEVATQIWNPFFTTKRTQGHLGLGLFVVHSILKSSLGGTVELDTRPGQGVMFRFEVPQMEQA